MAIKPCTRLTVFALAESSRRLPLTSCKATVAQSGLIWTACSCTVVRPSSPNRAIFWSGGAAFSPLPITFARRWRPSTAHREPAPPHPTPRALRCQRRDHDHRLRCRRRRRRRVPKQAAPPTTRRQPAAGFTSASVRFL
eukprot:1191639-Prorocentrum_minimum.AAC.7